MSVGRQFRRVLFGRDDRLRGTWRFLLAWPLLPLVGALVALVMPVLGLSGMIAGGPLQGVLFIVMLLVWARFVDRRPLSEYGVSASPSWLVDLLAALGVVVGVWTGWHALAVSLGWMQVGVAVTAPRGAVVFGLVGRFVSLAINSWVQDVVFFAIVLAGAAEGLRSRGLDPRRAVVGGWLVGVLFFTTIHGTPTVFDAVATAVGGAVFGLLYVHSGDLALTIGVHWGASYAAGTMFVARGSQGPALFHVTGSPPGDVGGEIRILLYLATYLLLLGWLGLSRGSITVETTLVDWPDPPRGLPGLGHSHGDG